MHRFARTRRPRFGNTEHLVGVAHKALRVHVRRAVAAANNNLHRVLKPTYFQSIPLDSIYRAVESTGLTIDPEERQCILVGRQGRATWPLTYQGVPVNARLWVSWYKMESGRYEVIGAVT